MTKTNQAELSPQGQRAGALQLHFEELTKNEQLLVVSLAVKGRPVRTIQEIQEELGWDRMRGSETMTGRARGCSRVRNTLRRLVRSQWVIHESEVGDGKYRLSEQALDRLRRLNKEMKKPNPKPVPPPLTDKQLEVAQATEQTTEQEF